ncbi:TPA: DUF6884 domain-containing protein [Vibrio parahaemolyticus]|uniref:DUF6884 domain-containing protein n=1 Tax=Vibrio campbellii TaxID=680 RepID=UPI001F077B34|nr:DUF6884 domain-containing protein [Vibrio campbellii]UMM06637.1 hypothetical protein MKR81_27200 [Vibrio campbellii]
MNKSVLIIGCSDAKADSALPAFDLYQGTMYQLIRANLPNIHDHCDVLILSAKHGLISSHQVIEPYDQRIAKRTNSSTVSQFVADHQQAAYKLLQQYADKGRNLHIVLSNDYLTAFDKLCDAPRFQKLLRRFNATYISRKHSGIGVLRGRLKKVLTAVVGGSSQPTLFRSGLANQDEFIGYSQANAALGASLAYVSDIKQPHLFDYIKQSLLEGNRAFLDNGIITEIGRGTFVSTEEVFTRYKQIVSKMPRSVSKKLAIVIPDNPFDNAESIDIVRRHKDDIKWLSSRADVILPVHRAPDVSEHATAMMKELNFITGIRLGVPCKESIKTDTGSMPVRLDLTDVEALFELKNPKGTSMFNGVHYLALSEVSRGKLYQERLLLAQIHGFDMSCDACRTAAVMGNEQNSNRIGSVTLRQVHQEQTESNTKNSRYFQEHGLHEEYEEPVIFQSAMEAIDNDVVSFVTKWNKFMDPVWELDINGMEEEAAKEYCSELICSFPREIEDQLLDKLKHHYWKMFYRDEYEPTSLNKRAETFSRLFFNGERMAVQTTLPI